LPTVGYGHAGTERSATGAASSLTGCAVDAVAGTAFCAVQVVRVFARFAILLRPVFEVAILIITIEVIRDGQSLVSEDFWNLLHLCEAQFGCGIAFPHLLKIGDSLQRDGVRHNLDDARLADLRDTYHPGTDRTCSDPMII
jgi:hypothetical protein